MVASRPRRSLLYLPASNPKALAKVRSLPCDVVILDLEDAVAPDLKDVARAAAVDAVRQGGFGHREVVVRANGLDTPWGASDLAELAEVGPDAILVPKVNDGADIRRYNDLISHAPTRTKLWAMIETSRAMFHLLDIAAQTQTTRLSGWIMGTNDLAKEMRAELDAARAPFLGFLAQSVAAARVYGITIVDGVFNAIEDEAGFETQCRQARAFGFDGKSLIHPRQIDPCNAVFTPSDAALAEAQNVVAAFALPENSDKGAIRVDGRMVERLHMEQARSLIAVREAIDNIEI